jgi:hypothetical protein
MDRRSLRAARCVAARRGAMGEAPDAAWRISLRAGDGGRGGRIVDAARPGSAMGSRECRGRWTKRGCGSSTAREGHSPGGVFSDPQSAVDRQAASERCADRVSRGRGGVRLGHAHGRLSRPRAGDRKVHRPVSVRGARSTTTLPTAWNKALADPGVTQGSRGSAAIPLLLRCAARRKAFTAPAPGRRPGSRCRRGPPPPRRRSSCR